MIVVINASTNLYRGVHLTFITKRKLFRIDVDTCTNPGNRGIFRFQKQRIISVVIFDLTRPTISIPKSVRRHHGLNQTESSFTLCATILTGVRPYRHILKTWRCISMCMSAGLRNILIGLGDGGRTLITPYRFLFCLFSFCRASDENGPWTFSFS